MQNVHAASDLIVGSELLQMMIVRMNYCDCCGYDCYCDYDNGHVAVVDLWHFDSLTMKNLNWMMSVVG